MDVTTHVIALVLRLLFHGLTLWGFGLLLFGRNRDGLRQHILILGSVGCLLASGAIVAPDFTQALWSLAVFTVLVAVDCAFYRMTPNSCNLLLPVVFLCGIGIVMVFDPVPVLPADVSGPDSQKHTLFIIAGMLVAVATAFFARKYLDALAAAYWFLLGTTVFLCALPLVRGLGVEEYGAKSWISIAGHRLQPSEFAKVTLSLALAGYLAANATRMRQLSASSFLRGVIPLSIVFCLALLMELVERDLGTDVVMFALFTSLLSLCSKRAGAVYGIVLGLLVTALLVLAVRFIPRVTARYEAWCNPAAAAKTVINDDGSEEDEYNKSLRSAGEHLLSCFDAIGNGGIMGTGLRFGVKRYYVHLVWNDGVYTEIVEELGVLGGAHVAIAILVLAIESARIARHLPEGSFERNMVLGSGCMTCVQAFIIMGGITGAIPLTGVTLPFVATGGSSILSCSMLIGLMGACASKAQQRTTNEFSLSALLVPIAVGISMIWCISCVVRLQPSVRFCGDTSADYKASDVYTSDGVALAEGGSVYSGTKAREYPQGTLAAHALGLMSDGLDAHLCAPKARTDINPFLNALALDQKAEDTVLTLDSSVQLVAERQLEGEVGAIVAMNTRTGAVMAEASSPTYSPAIDFDPNPSDDVYFNRAVDALYPPGSTFKVVTLSAALEAGEATLSSEYTSQPIDLGEGKITNLYYPESDTVTLREALVLSTNTAFAKLALQMGEEPIANMADALGFNHKIADPALDARMSTYETNHSDSKFEIAWAAVGQAINGHGASASVLQMCCVMSAIANGGMTCQPYLVESGPLASPRTGPTRAMSGETANAVWDAMVEASGIELGGAEVAGKTGTAENGDHGVRCWYICSSGDVAVACCVERESGTGADNAMPLAKEVLKAAIEIVA